MASSANTESIPPDGGMKYNALKAELDESLYNLEDEEVKFVMQQTGLKDADEVKQHIIKVQHEVYAVHAYPCIRMFAFAGYKVARYPIYNEVLQLAKERQGALLLDIGCCVGNDARKAVADGFPANQVIASDLQAEFWDIGHKVFKSTPESFPVKFVPGNIFDKSFLEPGPIITETPVNQAAVELTSLTTLTPLRGRLSAIHAGAFFHLFSEEQQAQLAHLLGSLLSPEPGSIIFGTHVGRTEKGLRVEALRPNTEGVRMFCHSPESFAALWEEVFGPGKVEVKVAIKTVERKDLKEITTPGVPIYFLVWSVKRL